MSQFDPSTLEFMNEKEREAFMAQVFERIKNIKNCEWSLYEFVKNAWPQVEGTKPFQPGWHIQVICEHLEACTRREIKKLLINIPPRFMKSTLIGVMWPAWTFLNNPSEQFLYASYASSLSIRDSVNCRRVIQSQWYQERWGNRFQLVGDQNTKGRFQNDKGGYRIATSVGSALTGEGGSIRVTDDPNNINDRSDLMLENTLDWYTGTWSTRKNNPQTDVLVNVQQRTSEKDVTAYLLNSDTGNDWIKLILPMEFEESRRAKTIVLPSTNGKVWEDPRQTEGELLWPDFWNAAKVAEGKKDLRSEYNVAGQFQQRPAPAAGGIIKKEWFSWWKEEKPPHLEYVMQSWDTGFSGKMEAAYSACITLGVFNDSNQIPNVILLNLWRGRVEYPDLRKLAQEFYRDYRCNGVNNVRPDGLHKPTMILVEGKASGHSLIQDFRRAGIPAVGFDPGRFGKLPGSGTAKEKRVHLISHLLEAGRVWVPAQPPHYTFLRRFADMLVENCAVFPNGESRDVVDALSQALIRLNLSGWVNHPQDETVGDTSMRIKMKLY